MSQYFSTGSEESLTFQFLLHALVRLKLSMSSGCTIFHHFQFDSSCSTCFTSLNHHIWFCTLTFCTTVWVWRETPEPTTKVVGLTETLHWERKSFLKEYLNNFVSVCKGPCVALYIVWSSGKDFFWRVLISWIPFSQI